MGRRIVNIVSVIILFSCTNDRTQTDTVNEVAIINDIFSSLYSLDYCHHHFPLYFDTTIKRYKTDSVKSLQERQSLEELQWFIAMPDTLKAFDVTKLQEKTMLSDSLLNWTESFPISSKPSRVLDIDSLDQDRVKLIDYNRNLPSIWSKPGPYPPDLYFGVIELHRVILNPSKDRGLTYYSTWEGGDCFYGRYVFIEKTMAGWQVVAIIEDWVG